MRVACLLAALLASGCNHVQLNGGSVYVQTGPAIVGLLGAAVLAANVNARSGFPEASRVAPEMLAERAVAEQDCTKPIEDWSANLKCR